jgi:hypothetical protein
MQQSIAGPVKSELEKSHIIISSPEGVASNFRNDAFQLGGCALDQTSAKLKAHAENVSARAKCTIHLSGVHEASDCADKTLIFTKGFFQRGVMRDARFPFFTTCP